MCGERSRGISATSATDKTWKKDPLGHRVQPSVLKKHPPNNGKQRSSLPLFAPFCPPVDAVPLPCSTPTHPPARRSAATRLPFSLLLPNPGRTSERTDDTHRTRQKQEARRPPTTTAEATNKERSQVFFFSSPTHKYNENST